MIRASALIALLIAGCSKISTQAPAPHAGNTWTHHGVLRFGEIFDPATLIPLLSVDQTTVELSMLWSGYLFNWNDRNEWVPELATEVPSLANGGISKDGLTIAYRLRPGVTWQDGVAFTADDVIFTYEQVMNPRNNVGSRTGYDLITHIQKLDDHTIAVRLRRPYAPFVATFFTMSGSPYSILPKHLLAGLSDLNHAAYNNLPIGTGPFRIVEWHKGSLIRFVANPHYWRGPPRLRAIEYHIIPDDNTILTQLRTHEIDIEYAASQSQAPSLRTIPGTTFALNPFTSFAMLAYNVKDPTLSDVRVRRALAFATDRRAILEKVAHGVPMPADSDQPPWLWAYNPAVARYPFDLSQAGALLDGAGWKLGADGYRYKNGARLELQSAGAAGSAIDRAVFAVLQQQWRRAGIDLTEKTYENALFLANYGEGGILQTGKWQISLFSWINGVDPDDSTIAMCDQWPPAGQNVYHYCNPKLDAAERAALTTYDEQARKRRYDEIQRILADDQPFLVIWFSRRINVFNSDLHNFKPAHAVTQFWNSWEWSI